MKKILFSILIFSAIIFCFPMSALGATISTNGTGGGNYTDPSTWFGGVVPLQANGDTSYIVYGDSIDEILSGEFCDQNEGTITTNNGYVDWNYGLITTSNGNVGVNGYSGVITDLYGEIIYDNNNLVDTNYGVIPTNYGTVANNYGEVSVNQGTIELFYSGSINANYGVIYTFGGTMNTNNGTIYGNSGGWVGTNSGTVENNNYGGSVSTNNGTVTINSDNGSVSTNNGTVTTNGSIGIIVDNSGTLTNPNEGTITTNNAYLDTNAAAGIVETNNNTINTNYGTVTTNNGTVTDNYGTVTTNNGVITNDYSAGPPGEGGATIEITVSITSVRIPERAVMDTNGPLLPGTEFRLPGGRIIIVRDSDGGIKSRQDFTDHYIRAGQAVTILLDDYINTDAPYKIYAEFGVVQESNHALCKSDCSNVDNPSSWYFFYLAYYNGYDWSSAYCPEICHALHHDELAVDPINVKTDPLDNSKHWRSPALFTIN